MFGQNQNPRHRHQAASAVSANEQEMMDVSMEGDTGTDNVARAFSQSASRTLEARPRGGEETDSTSFVLRVIKGIALVLIALFVCTGVVLSKVSLVSITGRMFNESGNDRTSEETRSTRSKLFIQLTLALLIPEAISFLTCLVRGLIGKTTNSFPWPNRWALLWVSTTSVVEVFTICGFIFGVACKLPPSLTILILNGCFCFPIGRYLIDKAISNRRRNSNQVSGYSQISDDDQQHAENEENMESTNQLQSKYLKYLLTALELLGFLMQLGVLVAIPILLSSIKYFSPSGNVARYVTATYILLPISLCIISFVWSGWIQNKAMKSADANCTARFKAGLIGSAFKLLLIPFVSYGYARLLLDLNVDLHLGSFDWNGLELSTFLTHVIISYLTYFLAWIACALQSWSFFIPMLISTPISFVWYVISRTNNYWFPFINEYHFTEWNLNYVVFIIASFLWVSQFLAFSYHVLQKSQNVLIKDADLFWMPRYSGVFLEQQLLLNRKTAISGPVIESKVAVHRQKFSTNNFIFICSTMYHESELEMKQMLTSIDRIARADTHRDRNNTFESHIFFDGGCSGEQPNDWAIQLLGLLKGTLGIKRVNNVKVITPYGMQLKYNLLGKMPFYIHLKDNSKVKNKKRWSQVMYMKYVLDYRIKQSEKSGNRENRILKEKAFILTTDADIDFTNGSVIALLDILARDSKIGAVCARTHPLGSGPVVWYQIFDYAIGHWFQKAAEHILGCVLCCPGCFSVFRVSALEEVIKTYSSGVENGFDFLTKDMGEDRWLCTLLIKEGWRLEYSAVSQDSTYCPETFEEFYKQRRRWIPSTIANLALVISSWYKITSRNDSITILFILYESLILFSSLISPATVILIIVTGIRAIDPNIHELTLILTLSVISILFGVICIYAGEKTQLNIAKLLTIVFSILMGIVVSGIISDIINGIVEEKEMRHDNQTSQDYQFPVDVSTIYSGIFAATFILAGILHLNEFFYLFHSIWYLLCLPSGYLFLIIYSVCNINNRSWGTREGTRPKSNSGSNSWLDYFLNKWHRFLDFVNKCIRRKQRPQVKDPNTGKNTMIENTDAINPLILYSELDEDVKTWLREHKCDKMYAENFEREGYTKINFIATMKMEDLIAIGIDKRGFQLKLEKEIKKLPTQNFETNVPENVSQWLKNLQLEEYEALFESEGYFSGEDVENLKGLTKKDLRGMGITKRAHLNQLTTGLRYLQYPTAIDIRIIKTRALMDSALKLSLGDIEDKNGTTNKAENEFWDKLARTALKPESANLGKVEELKEKLRNLRNLSVLILLLVNVMWIVFLYTLRFSELTKFNLPDRAFSLLFLIIFSIIVLIQFFAMVFHRFETLFHLLAGIRRRDNGAAQWTDHQVLEVTYAHNDSNF